MTGSDVEAAIVASGKTKLQLSRDTGVGTTTIWRACKGLPIDGKSAQKLRAALPELDLDALISGSQSESPSADDAPKSSESGEHPAVPDEKLEAAAVRS